MIALVDNYDAFASLLQVKHGCRRLQSAEEINKRMKEFEITLKKSIPNP